MIGKRHRIRRVLRQHRYLLAAAVTLLTILGGIVGYFGYESSVTVILVKTGSDQETQPASDLTPLLQQRLSDPRLMEAAARDGRLATQAGELSSAVTVRPSAAFPAGVELVVRLADPAEAVALANALAKRALTIASEITATPGKTMMPLYEEKLLQAEKQLKDCTERLMAFEKETGSGERDKNLEDYSKHREELETKLAENDSLARTLTLQVKNLQQEIALHHPAVLTAKQALDRALLRYTEDHPKVEELKLTLAAVQARVRDAKDEVDPEIALNGTSLAQGLYSKWMSLRGEEKLLAGKKQEMLASLANLNQKIESFPETQVRYARLKSDYQLWNATHQELLRERNQQQLLAATARVPFTIQQSPFDSGSSTAHRWCFAAVVGFAFSALGGMGLSVGLAWHACRDPRIKSEVELLSATSLPLLGKLPNLNSLALEDQERWAFHAFSHLKAKLAPAQGSALVCGFTSSRRGEGRSTWIRLLAGAARRQGYQVLVLAAVQALPEEEGTQEQPGNGNEDEAPGVTLFGGAQAVHVTTESLTHTQAFALPAQAAWSLQNRLQWQQGIQELGKVPNRVILVEFPPASEPETVLLAQDFPNLIWVCGKDVAASDEIRAQLETLNGSRVKVVGTVLNFSEA